jgi:hypothetical protein
MAGIKLPPNVTLDSNTGLYIIRNPQGQTIRVGADTQAQLDQYVNSVNTGVPTSITVTDPNTGNPRTSNFDPTAIIQQSNEIAAQNALLTTTKRQTGLLGNTDGTYTDFRTGQTLTQAEAAAKIQAAGLPPEALVAITPKNAPTYAAAQAAVNDTTNTPSNRTGVNAEQPSQSPAATNTNIAPTAPAAPAVEAQQPAAPAADTVPAAATAPQPEAAAATPVTPSELADPTVNNAPPQPDATAATPVFYNDELPPNSTQTAENLIQNTAPAPVFYNDELPPNSTQTAQDLIQNTAPAPVPPSGLPYRNDFTGSYVGQNGEVPPIIGDFNPEASLEQAIKSAAQDQSTLQQRYGQTTNSGDWRVRIRLATGANYLYKDNSNDLMAPLRTSDGVIFPYVPTVNTNYVADYDAKALTHSNYRGLFYKSSYVNDIGITGTFTAQNTPEAKYLLAVIHFFRSATKMFYGQDAQRGAPPPVVYLSGFGQYQFNNHPCVIANFQYQLPNSVDYIRIDPNNQGQNLVVNRSQVSSSPSPISSVLSRLESLKNIITGTTVQAGAQGSGNQAQDLGAVSGTVSGTAQTTYVPTRMDITVTLRPIQTRSQISQQFSLKDFANGSLLKQGFW